MKPIHIICNKEDIAPVVIMPGDPLRAQYIASTYLRNYKLVCSIRNNLVYTGYYNNHRVTIASSGMGIPSMGIYAYELFHFYGVEKIIRIGTCGCLDPSIHVRDIILCDNAYSISSFPYAWGKENVNLIESDKEITDALYKINPNLKRGSMYTSDVFDVYADISHIINNAPVKLLGSEMEAFGLFYIAKKENKKAACMATITDSKYEPDVILNHEERQVQLNEMIKTALSILE